MRVLFSWLAVGTLVLGANIAQAQPGGYYQPPPDHVDHPGHPHGGPPGHAYGHRPGGVGVGVGMGGAYLYVGLHPVPYEVGSGFCTVQGAHNHNYQPFDNYLFRQVNNSYYFVGDPYDFGYTQQLNWYRGHHPIADDFGGGFCYMTWPHRHHYGPAQNYMPYYRNIGGHWVYRGQFGQPYYNFRDRYGSYYNNYYRSWYYGNRYYRLRPRHVYRGVDIQVMPQPVPQPVMVPQPMPQPVMVPQPMPQPVPVYTPPPPRRVYGVPQPQYPEYGTPGTGANYVPAAPAYGGGAPAGNYVPPPPPAPAIR